MKKHQWFAAGTLAVLLLSALAACGSTGPSKAELEQREAQKAEAKRLAQEKGEAAWKAAEEKAEAERRTAAVKAEAERKATEERAAEERQAAIDAANAKGVTAEDFDYDVTRDGTGIVITRYKGMATIVNIPAVIEGLPVKELGTSKELGMSRTFRATPVFSGNTRIVSVTLPDSLTTIPDGQRRWSSFEPSGAFGAFENCTSLSSVTLSRNLKKIPGNMFTGCTGLTSVTIPEGVTDIGEQAFAECSGLTSVTLPNSITAIDKYAFYGCSSLAAVTLPDSLSFMGAGAFKNCGLTGVVLPGNLRTLEGAFHNPDAIFYRDEAVVRGEDYWLGAGQFEDCGKLESATIEGGGLELFRTFAGCVSLTTLTINGNVTLLRDDPYSKNVPAFSGCPLTTVNIGPKVTRIGNPDDLINAGKLSTATKAALARLR
jgi:predicted small lipoprotein YifL